MRKYAIPSYFFGILAKNAENPLKFKKFKKNQKKIKKFKVFPLKFKKFKILRVSGEFLGARLWRKLEW
jgi:hypothetical protein